MYTINNYKQKSLTINYTLIAISISILIITVVMPANYNIGLLFILLLFIFSIIFYNKVKISKKYYIAAAIYVLIIIYSFKNPVLYIDFKYHISFFLSLIFFNQILKTKESIVTLFKVCFYTSVVVFITYLFLYLNILPSDLFRDEDVPEYQKFRIVGPPLSIFLLLPFLYSRDDFQKKLYYKYLLIGLVIGFFSTLLSGSNQALVLMFIFYFIGLIEFKFKIFLVIATMFIGFMLISPYILSDSNFDKIAQIMDPLQSQTILTRISDLAYAYDDMMKRGVSFYFGEGIGVKTEVLRFWQDGKNFEFNEFLEIDNGFFYVFHRLGFYGLILYVGIIGYIIYKYGSVRNKLMYLSFFLVTNLLSIHFFTSIFSAFFTYLFIKDNNK